MMSKKRVILYGVLFILFACILNVIIVEIRVNSVVSKIELELSEKEIIDLLGSPSLVLREERKGLMYQFPYAWDYPCLWFNPTTMQQGEMRGVMPRSIIVVLSEETEKTIHVMGILPYVELMYVEKDQE